MPRDKVSFDSMCRYLKDSLDNQTLKIIPRMFDDEFPLFNIEYKNRLYRLSQSVNLQLGLDLSVPVHVVETYCVYPDMIYYMQIDSTYRNIRDSKTTERIYYERWIDYLNRFRTITGINPDIY